MIWYSFVWFMGNINVILLDFGQKSLSAWTHLQLWQVPTYSNTHLEPRNFPKNVLTVCSIQFSFHILDAILQKIFTWHFVSMFNLILVLRIIVIYTHVSISSLHRSQIMHMSFNKSLEWSVALIGSPTCTYFWSRVPVHGSPNRNRVPALKVDGELNLLFNHITSSKLT